MHYNDIAEEALLVESLRELKCKNIFPVLNGKKLIEIYEKSLPIGPKKPYLLWEYIKKYSVLSSIKDVNAIFQAKIKGEKDNKYYLAYEPLFSVNKLSSKITIFSGGSGSNSLVSGLLGHLDKEGDINILINAYDDGKSTGDIKSKLNILGPSDIAKNLSLLIVKEVPELEKFLNYRFCASSVVRANEVFSIIKQHNLLKENCSSSITACQREGLEAWITSFLTKVTEWEKRNKKIWNLSDYAIRNMVYVGAYYENDQNHIYTIKRITDFFGLKGHVIINSEDLLYLVGVTENNKFLSSEDAIVSSCLDENIQDVYILTKEQYGLVKSYSLEEKLNFLKIANKLEPYEEQELKKLETIDSVIDYLSKKNVRPIPTPEALASIMEASFLFFAPTTLHSSLIPTLKTYGLMEKLNNTKVPLVFIGNLGIERGDHGLADQLELIKELCPCENSINKYAIIPPHRLSSERYMYKGEELKSLPINLHKIKALGLEPIEAEIKDKNGTHASYLTSSITLSLVNLHRKGLAIKNGNLVSLSELVLENQNNKINQLRELSKKPYLYSQYKEKIEKWSLELQGCGSLEEYKKKIKSCSQAKVIILAAGNSLRLKFRPKALYPINGIANIEYILEAIRDFDYKPIIVVNHIDLSYFNNWKQRFFEQTSREVHVVSTEALGSGGSLLHVKDEISKIIEEDLKSDVILVWGDITNITFSSILKSLLISTATRSVLTIPTCLEPKPYAGIKRDCLGNVIDFFQTKDMKSNEKPQYGEHDGSFFIMNEKKLWHYLSKIFDEQKKDLIFSREIRFEKIISKCHEAKEVITAVPLLENFETIGFNTQAEASLIGRAIRRKSYQMDLDTALKKTYNALVLDVDGTITDTNSEIPEQIINYILEKATTKIPIGIITARNSDSLEHILLHRLGRALNVYIYCDAAAKGFRLSDRKILYDLPSISEDLLLRALEIIKYVLPPLHAYKCSPHKVQVWLENILYEKAICLIKAINYLLKTSMVNLSAYLSTYHNNNASLIITHSNKKEALDNFRNHNKLAINKIAKIGEMGDKFGIDHGMLIGRGAFSVGEWDSTSMQIPVRKITSYGGLKATQYILERLDLVSKRE